MLTTDRTTERKGAIRTLNSFWHDMSDVDLSLTYRLLCLVHMESFQSNCVVDLDSNTIAWSETDAGSDAEFAATAQQLIKLVVAELWESAQAESTTPTDERRCLDKIDFLVDRYRLDWSETAVGSRDNWQARVDIIGLP